MTEIDKKRKPNDLGLTIFLILIKVIIYINKRKTMRMNLKNKLKH